MAMPAHAPGCEDVQVQVKVAHNCDTPAPVSLVAEKKQAGSRGLQEHLGWPGSACVVQQQQTEIWTGSVMLVNIQCIAILALRWEFRLSL